MSMRGGSLVTLTSSNNDLFVGRLRLAVIDNDSTSKEG